MIAEIEKNKGEILRVELAEFKGYKLVNLRIFYKHAYDDWRPTKKGLTWRVERLPELRAALADAEAEARRLGLLGDG